MDESVAQHHATIVQVNDNDIEIRDEGTLTETFVNGKRLSCSGVISPYHRIKTNDKRLTQ